MAKVTIQLDGLIPGTDVPVPTKPVIREVFTLDEAVTIVKAFVEAGFAFTSYKIEDEVDA